MQTTVISVEHLFFFIWSYVILEAASKKTVLEKPWQRMEQENSTHLFLDGKAQRARETRLVLVLH
jgi:hypothetical protein